jgi:hypothetical protein
MDEKKKERKARNKRKIKTDRKNDESMRKTSKVLSFVSLLFL